MGGVFKARQLSMDRIVALKILPKDLAADENYVQRFVQEARRAGQLFHPHLLQVYEVGKADGYYFFSMEYADGMNLKQWLKQEGPIGEELARMWMLKIAGALGEAHRAGIVHRDVKPSNILLNDRGEPKLADLGLAKPLSAAGEASVSAISIGTPFYMAPEQALGQAVDGRADFYSLGATFYHLITGQMLFMGNNYKEIMLKHIHDAPPRIRRTRRDYSVEFERMLNKLLSKKVEERFENAEVLIRVLEGIAPRGSSGRRTSASHRQRSPHSHSRSGRRSAAIRRQLKPSNSSSLPWFLGIFGLIALFFILMGLYPDAQEKNFFRRIEKRMGMDVGERDIRIKEQAEP